MSIAAEMRTIASFDQPFSLARRCQVSANSFWNALRRERIHAEDELGDTRLKPWIAASIGV